jgi:hypothetical protein
VNQNCRNFGSQQTHLLFETPLFDTFCIKSSILVIDPYPALSSQGTTTKPKSALPTRHHTKWRSRQMSPGHCRAMMPNVAESMESDGYGPYGFPKSKGTSPVLLIMIEPPLNQVIFETDDWGTTPY